MELCSLLTVPCTYCSNEMQNEVSDGGDLSALYNKFEQAHKINPRVMYLAYEAGSFSEPDLNKQEFLEYARRVRDKNLLMWCVTCAKAFEGCLEQTSSRECPRCKNSDGVRKVLLDPNVLYEDGDMTLPQDNNSKNPGVFWKGTIHDRQPMILNLQLKFQEKVNKERIEWIWGESDESRNSNALTVAKKIVAGQPSLAGHSVEELTKQLEVEITTAVEITSISLRARLHGSQGGSSPSQRLC